MEKEKEKEMGMELEAGNVIGAEFELSAGNENEIAQANEKTVAVYLLTGFLGSGKTTLLRRLIAATQERGLEPAVLMNEVGDVNLDGMAVDAEVPMAELLGGCICCTIKSDVALELVQLIKRYHPDVVFIESTGVAQPLEILDAVSEASLYARAELSGVATVVDARHLLDRLRIGTGKTFKLMRDQIRVSSFILLNKADLVGPAELAELNEWLREWNPAASIQQTVRCEAKWSALWNKLQQNSAAQAAKHHAGPSVSSTGQAVSKSADEEAHVHHHHDHDHVHVMTRYLPGAVNSERFEQFLRDLPSGVYRAKGIVTFTDTASRFLFQYAYRESDFMRITPQKTVHDVAVFIGEDFSEAELESKLNVLFADAV
ncbi:CobW family GTP-binding protein [Cohnella lubricantis]|nr:CobW family GTP-binding protein [Cohnella lubricantis]MBP2118652.1 G3E family GTPase [Cohnella lubricantis]